MKERYLWIRAYYPSELHEIIGLIKVLRIGHRRGDLIRPTKYKTLFVFPGQIGTFKYSLNNNFYKYKSLINQKEVVKTIFEYIPNKIN